MNRNSETEVLNNGEIIDDNRLGEELEQNTKKRRLPMRHKSNEMILNNTPDRAKLAQSRLSSSFAGYDYKGHAVLSKTHSFEKDEGKIAIYVNKLAIHWFLQQKSSNCKIVDSPPWMLV